MSDEEYIKKLEDEITNLKERLKKYTAPTRQKTYYENHKEELIQKNKDYREKTNYVYEVPPTKKKAYARKAYLNKKEKMQKEKEQREKEQNENSTDENI